jgi:hypothetical protein
LNPRLEAVEWGTPNPTVERHFCGRSAFGRDNEPTGVLPSPRAPPVRPDRSVHGLPESRIDRLLVKAGPALGSVLDDLLALEIVTGVIGGAIRCQP